MAITFLCWNLQQKPLQRRIAEIARTRDVDVLVLLECPRVEDLLGILNQGDGPVYHYAPSRAETPEESIKIFARFSPEFLQPLDESTRHTIRQLRLPLCTEVLLAAVHLSSKLHSDSSSQILACTQWAETIADAERRVGHSNTMLVGDLNMNPFEAGVVGAGGFHATMARAQALRGHRTVQGREYPFFYNPMWGCFGERDETPAGTYFRDSSEHVNYYWNMFDQVLLRPSLVDRLSNEGVEIVTRAGEVSLISTSGRPDQSVGSDHLPILFRMGL
jgi:endonuclease/exonuclease/phosphatase family metal-dependent hydrolase